MESQTNNTRLSKVLSIFLALAIVGAVIALIYTVAVPAPREAFTEFYILDTDGKATDYPAQLKVGEAAELILGINNQENMAVSYRVEIKIDGVTNGELGPIALNHNEKFEQLVTFTPDKAGEKQKIEFLLYKQGETRVYQSLHLWVDVAEL